MAEKNASSEAIPPEMKQRILNIATEKAADMIGQQIRLGDKIFQELLPGVKFGQLYIAVGKLEKWDKHMLSISEMGHF